MREILFRGKTKKNKWIEGNLIYGQDGVSYISAINESPIYKNIDYWYIDTPTFEVISETIGQFTGLLDKNSNKIFEGDILKLYDPYADVWSVNGAKVVFSYKYAGGWVLESTELKHLNIGTRTQHVEIIGNIHDNPELLEASI